jgi:cullin-associated NEDD8-dissociated protein 1
MCLYIKEECIALFKFVCFSRQAGHRFGEQIERVMPLIVQYSNEDDDELREYCLQAFESFVYRCPKEITPHINKVM